MPPDLDQLRTLFRVLQEFVQHKNTCDYWRFPLATVPHCTCGLWSVADRLESALTPTSPETEAPPVPAAIVAAQGL